MDYVDTFYADNPTLARSIYGKRAASSLTAARETLLRRAVALKGPADQRVADQDGSDLFSGDAVDDDDAWERAEAAVVAARTRDKKGELEVIDRTLDDNPPRHRTWPGPVEMGRACSGCWNGTTLSQVPGNCWCSPSSPTRPAGSPACSPRPGTQPRRLRAWSSTATGTGCSRISSPASSRSWSPPMRAARVSTCSPRTSWSTGISHGALSGSNSGWAGCTASGSATTFSSTTWSARRPERAAFRRSCWKISARPVEALGGRIFDLLDATADRASFDYTKAMVDRPGQRNCRADHPSAGHGRAHQHRKDAGCRGTATALANRYQGRGGTVPCRPTGGHQPCHRRWLRRTTRGGDGLAAYSRAPSPACG